MERLGLAVETVDPTGSEREVDVKVIDKATGKISIVKKSVKLDPDPGWGYHPGKSMWGGLLKAGEKSGKYRDMPLPGPKQQYDPLQKARAEKLRWFPEEDVLESGLADSVYITAFQDKYGGDSKVVKDPLGDSVLLSLRAFQADKSREAEEDLKTDKPGHGEAVELLEEMATKPFEVWLVPQVNDAGRVRLVKRYISLWKVDNEGKIKIGAWAEFETVDGILQGVTAFAPTTRSGAPNLEYLDRQRTGVRLYPPKRDRSKEKK